MSGKLIGKKVEYQVYVSGKKWPEKRTGTILDGNFIHTVDGVEYFVLIQGDDGKCLVRSSEGIRLLPEKKEQELLTENED